MSSAFSKNMQGVATKLLTKYGSSVSLIKVGARTWDPDEGEYVKQPDTTYPLTAVPVPVNANLVDGTTIQAGDMQVICDLKVEPLSEDKVEFQGHRWSIVAIKQSVVSDDRIVYFIQVRK